LHERGRRDEEEEEEEGGIVTLLNEYIKNQSHKRRGVFEN
jgi:hypothetical protein